MAAGTLTLAEVRALAQQESDMVSSNFVSTAEWNSYINQSASELYDLQVTCYGNDYFVKTPFPTFTTDGIADLFALPTDFYKLIGLDIQLSGGQWATLKRFNSNERNRNQGISSGQFYGYADLRYRLAGSNIWFDRVPTAGLVIREIYVPRMPVLSSDSDVLDGINGWTEYVVVDAAIKAKDKEESDVSVLMARKNGLIARIQAAGEARDAGQPFTVSDNVSRQFPNYYRDPFGEY